MGVEMARFVGWPKTLQGLGTWIVAPLCRKLVKRFFG